MPIGPFMSALIPTAVNTLGNLFGAGIQQNQAQQNAAAQHKMNMKLLKYQNEYNSPAAQMARYEEAGLNKHLIYGQGTPGNIQQVPKYPDIQTPNYQQALSNVGTQFVQAKAMQAQTDLTETKVEESGVKQDLMRSQQQLIAANPYLNKDYVAAMVSNLESTAAIKLQDVAFNPVSRDLNNRKTLKDIEILEQKYRLGESDQKIKAQIIESKQFQNDLQQIQLSWLKNGDITPQHIYQGILLLLSKMM